MLWVLFNLFYVIVPRFTTFLRTLLFTILFNLALPKHKVLFLLTYITLLFLKCKVMTERWRTFAGKFLFQLLYYVISEWNVGYLLKGLLIPKTYIRIILKIIAFIALPLFFRTHSSHVNTQLGFKDSSSRAERSWSRSYRMQIGTSSLTACQQVEPMSN